MPTTTVTININSSKAQSVISMSRTHDESDGSLTLTFNDDYETKAISPATAKSQAVITMARTHDEVDATLTLDFNTTFNLRVIELVTISLVAGLEVLDVKPIILYSRTGNPSAIMYSRVNDSLPAIFYSRPPLVLINQTDDSLTGVFNALRTRRVPEVSSSKSQAVVTVAQTKDKTDSSLTGGFSWSVA